MTRRTRRPVTPAARAWSTEYEQLTHSPLGAPTGADRRRSSGHASGSAGCFSCSSFASTWSTRSWLRSRWRSRRRVRVLAARCESRGGAFAMPASTSKRGAALPFTGRCKRQRECRRRDSNPRNADYDSARLWLCRAECGRYGARMAHRSRTCRASRVPGAVHIELGRGGRLEQPAAHRDPRRERSVSKQCWIAGR
jgi:hypothetical protein